MGTYGQKQWVALLELLLICFYARVFQIFIPLARELPLRRLRLYTCRHGHLLGAGIELLTLPVRNLGFDNWFPKFMYIRHSESM